MKILIVEDQLGQLMLRVLKRIYPDAMVMLAINGKDGYRSYLDFKPDLVISDWNMPRMHGGEMAKHIRTLNPQQRIILWSASSIEEFAGYTQFFNQIVDKGILADTLKEVIAGVMSENLESAKQSG